MSKRIVTALAMMWAAAAAVPLALVACGAMSFVRPRCVDLSLNSFAVGYTRNCVEVQSDIVTTGNYILNSLLDVK